MDLKSIKARRALAIFALFAVGLALLFIGKAEKSKDKSEDVSVISLAEYESALEEKIKALCENVDGVSNVSVAVSLSSGGEYVYAKDGRDDYVLVGSGSSEGGVLISERAPQISGIGIVCNFSGDETVKYRLISLISASCGVGSNKIFIAEAKK